MSPSGRNINHAGPGAKKWRSYALLLLLSAAVLFVHGYHPGVEDGEIYIPGIKKILNPSLYPFGSEFFLNHARLTLFDELIAATVRVSHLSFDVVLFLWYGLSTFLTLFACWRLSGECFQEPEARWAGVALVGALFTIPVAGTSLYIADQYLTSRSIATFAILFAVWNAWKRRKAASILWSVFALCIHPLMAVFGISYTALLWFHREWNIRKLSLACALVAVPSAYEQAVSTRSYFFILQWQWYELLGAVAPLILLWLIGSFCERRGLHNVRIMSNALVVYGVFYLAVALAVTTPKRFEALALYQPMRSLHLLYIFLFLLGGGMMGNWLLQRHAWRWIGLFLPVCAGMYLAQRQLFPASPHIEWPAARPGNDWLLGFEWIRGNTPAEAVFAVDPEYMLKDDQHGFRAIAERSRLADAVKDSGAVTMFPQLPSADHWLEQVTAQAGWRHLQDSDFRHLKQLYGVSWVVLERPASTNFACPYENRTLQVCKVD